MKQFIKSFDSTSMKDVAQVGGKNASLGEMIRILGPLGIDVPGGFAITVAAFNEFLSANGLTQIIQKNLSNLNTVGEACRSLICNATLPWVIIDEITTEYNKLMAQGLIHSVAVRSSATAEDSPDASFAGQHDSFLNVTGIDNVLAAVKNCY